MYERNRGRVQAESEKAVSVPLFCELLQSEYIMYWYFVSVVICGICRFHIEGVGLIGIREG
jgi:hypothetical protein